MFDVNRRKFLQLSSLCFVPDFQYLAESGFEKNQYTSSVQHHDFGRFIEVNSNRNAFETVKNFLANNSGKMYPSPGNAASNTSSILQIDCEKLGNGSSHLAYSSIKMAAACKPMIIAAQKVADIHRRIRKKDFLKHFEGVDFLLVDGMPYLYGRDVETSEKWTCLNSLRKVFERISSNQGKVIVTGGTGDLSFGDLDDAIFFFGHKQAITSQEIEETISSLVWNMASARINSPDKLDAIEIFEGRLRDPVWVNRLTLQNSFEIDQIRQVIPIIIDEMWKTNKGSISIRQIEGMIVRTNAIHRYLKIPIVDAAINALKGFPRHS